MQSSILSFVSKRPRLANPSTEPDHVVSIEISEASSSANQNLPVQRPRPARASKPKIPPASCDEIARLGLTSGAKPSCRFYNNALRGVYNSCTLPTENASAMLHTTLSSTYSVTTTQKSSWKHTTRKPPRTTGQAIGG